MSDAEATRRVKELLRQPTDCTEKLEQLTQVVQDDPDALHDHDWHRFADDGNPNHPED